MQLANQRPGNSDTLSQHTVVLTSNPSMQLAKQKPWKLDTLSLHASETNHRSGKLDMLSQCTQGRHAIQAYTAKLTCIKEAAKAQNSGQADTAK